MAYISVLKMVLEGSFLKRKLCARKFGKIPEKSRKILKKFPRDWGVLKIANKSLKYSNKLFCLLEKSRKFPKKL